METIGILGTGIVAKTLAPALVDLGHSVTLGSRATSNLELEEWASEANVGYATFAAAAASASLVINATGGTVSLAALQAAGAENLKGKVLLDLSNPLDFSQGFPPSLSVCNTDSLAEQIQSSFPETDVVKALNTVSCDLMIAPNRIAGNHQLPICANDEQARKVVTDLLKQLGWKSEQLIQLPTLDFARGTEMYLALWVRMYGVLDTDLFNLEFHVGS